MANETVTVFGDQETSEFFTGNSGTSSNPLLMLVGDTLTISHASYSQTNGAIYVSSWASSHWTSTTGVAVGAGSTTTKTVKTGATLNVTDTISIQRTGFTTAYIYVKIVSGVDTTPNDFSGSLSNITGAVPSQEYLIGSFQVAGINTSVSLSVSGTASPQSQVGNNGTKSSSVKTVNNGSLIYIYGTAPSSYNSSSTVSTTVGSTTVSRTITTPTDPATGTRIPFTPSSGTISLDDVRSFFGPKTGTAPISNYYRGGTYVINTTTGSPNNSGIPASGTIALDDFYNSFTTMYFSTAPGNKSDFLVTSTSSDTTTLNWNRDDDWEIGFGPDMEDGVDYRITHETTVYGGNINEPSVYQISFGGTTRDLTVAANRSSHTFAYSSNNANAITVTVTAPTTTEKFIQGKITFTIRHKEQPSYTDSTVFYYYVTIYGP
jgi:co-chaperonin GroES (HSP10)